MQDEDMLYDKQADCLTLTLPEFTRVSGFLGSPSTGSEDDSLITLPYGEAREFLAKVDALGVPEDSEVRALLDAIGALMIRGHHNPGDMVHSVFGPEELQPYPGAEAPFVTY